MSPKRRPKSTPRSERAASSGAVDAEALAAHAGKLWRALHAKLKARDPKLARELRAALRAHMAVVVALFGSEVAELRREIG